MKKYKILNLIVLFAIFALTGLVALNADAQYKPPTQVPVPGGTAPIQSGGQIIDVFNKILEWFATAFWIAAAGFIFYAAFLYLTAAGDETKVKKAKNALIYAIIAVIVGVMAYGLPTLVKNILGKQ